MILARSNAELDQALTNPGGDFCVHLEGTFSPVRIRQRFALPVRLFAHRAFIRGVTFDGANIVLNGGTVEAPMGAGGFARAGYGIDLLPAAQDITVNAVKIRNASRGVVSSGGKRLSVTCCDIAVRADGIISSGGEDITFANNWFHDFYPTPTECTLRDGTVVNGLSGRSCLAQGGVFKDGDHSDAIQLRNGMKRVSIVGNVIQSISQGIGQMDGPNDLPMDGVWIIGNNVEVTGAHSITIGRSTNVVVIGNRTKQMTGRRSPLRLPADAIQRDNEVLSP